VHTQKYSPQNFLCYNSIKYRRESDEQPNGPNPLHVTLPFDNFGHFLDMVCWYSNRPVPLWGVHLFASGSVRACGCIRAVGRFPLYACLQYLHQITMKVRVSARARLYMVIGAGSALLLTAGIVAWASASSQPEVAITPVLDCDNNWLTTETNDIDYSTKQVRLFLDNRDPSLCNGNGMLEAQITKLAHKYFSASIVDTNNPKNPNYTKTQEQALLSYARNITAELTKTNGGNDPTKLAGAIIKLQALAIALNAVTTGGPMPVTKGGGANFLVTLVDNLERDLKRFSESRPEGMAQQLRKERAQQKEADKELESGTIELK